MHCVKTSANPHAAANDAVHAGWSQDSSQVPNVWHANCRPTWPLGTNSVSSKLTATKHQHSMLQPAQQEPSNSNLHKQAPMLKLEPAAKKKLIDYPITKHTRPANNPYDSIGFEQQQQRQCLWLQGVSQCLSKLAGVSEEGKLLQRTLTVPWAWIARDLIQLLPVSSCYSYFMEDDDLFCQFLQQLTADNPQELSPAGAKMMASILCALAKADPHALAEYMEASSAVLRRVKDVCTALCNSNRSSEAADYAVNVAGCLLLHHKAGVRNARIKAAKKSMHLLLLLPPDQQSSACSELVRSHQSYLDVLLKLQDIPEPLGHSQVSWAVTVLERRLRIYKKASQRELSNICEWAVWATATTYSSGPCLQMVQLAVHANQLLQATTVRMPASTLSPLHKYTDFIWQACQPAKLDIEKADAHHKHDAHTVGMVYWVALLYSSSAQQHKHQAAGGASKHQMYSYLLHVTNSIQADMVDNASLQGMYRALHKLSPSMATNSQHQQPLRADLSSSHKNPAAASRPNETASKPTLFPMQATVVQGMVSYLQATQFPFVTCILAAFTSVAYATTATLCCCCFGSHVGKYTKSVV